MAVEIRKIGIIGSGAMGSKLAALMAGSGADVLLLDIEARAFESIRNIAGMKPAPYYLKSDLSRIRPGNITDDFEGLADCEWIIETVVERLGVKREMFAYLENVVGPDVVVTSNTSGMLWRMLAEGRTPYFRRRFFITHFFNPPRHMKLVEIVVGPKTDEDAVRRVALFLEEKLGKGIIRAKDTPAFVANRVGVFHAIDVMHRVAEENWPIEAVDAVLGRATARPKAGLFRTIDMVGLDVLAYSVETLLKGCRDESLRRLRIPQYMQRMLANGWIGKKAGRGFYCRDAKSGEQLVFDPAKADYREARPFAPPSLDEVRNIEDPAERLRRVVFAEDDAGAIAWPSVMRTLLYAARRAPEISDDILSVDRAMRWGYNWELGPFEMWDALGVEGVARRLSDEGVDPPPLVKALLKSGRKSFYERRDERQIYFDFNRAVHGHFEDSGRHNIIARLKGRKMMVEGNASASIVDMGDGIFACEFHTKMNAIDGDVISMVLRAVDLAEGNGIGLLIANEGEHFSVGANLKMIMTAVEKRGFDDIERWLVDFQKMVQRIRFSKRPVVAALFGMALGGGCEIGLACPMRVASIETYMGLVEMGVGLIPGGGGCKNLLIRLGGVMKGGPQPKVDHVFKLISTGRVSISARDAIRLNFMSKDDAVVMDRDDLMVEAKRHLIEIAGLYVSPEPVGIELPGRGGEMALRAAAGDMQKKGVATEYDAFIAGKLAHVLAGGNVPTCHVATEDHVLDLEREAFMSLVGEKRTRQRIEHMLKTGKVLRN